MLSPKADVEVMVPTKINADHVRWNLDMNVTVSNTKSTTIFPRLCTLFVIVLSVVLIAVVLHQRKQAKALQVEIQRMNVNVLRLISKYDKINRDINRSYFHRVTRDYDSIESLIHGLSHVSDIYGNGGRNFNTTSLTSYSDQAIASIHAQSIDHRENVIEKGVSDILDSVAMPLMRSKNNSAIDLKQEQSFLRTARALLTSQVQNRTMTGDERSNSDILNWREPRARRLRRDEGRGKKRRQHRRKPKRSRGRLGPLVATFIGAIPEQHITDAVYVGPWIKSNKNDSQYSLTKFHLVEDKMSIEVTASGLYMISVQIFYFGESANYSYWVLLNSEGVSTTQKLTKCATASSSIAAEVSCQTIVTTYLQKGDRLRIQQQERNRFINMREGYSSIQLVLLANDVPRKRSS